jgi:Tfp pilus assembly protein PilF
MTDRQKVYCRETARRAQDRLERAVDHIESGNCETAADMLERVIAECKALRKSLKAMGADDAV